jgi:hypothetical protein
MKKNEKYTKVEADFLSFKHKKYVLELIYLLVGANYSNIRKIIRNLENG